MNLPVTDVLRCTSSSAKTMRLNHLQLPDMGTGGGPAGWAPAIHHEMNGLLVKQGTVPDRQTTPPVHERSQHSQPLGRFVHKLVDVSCLPEPSVIR
jgi:hypothetical protein